MRQKFSRLSSPKLESAGRIQCANVADRGCVGDPPQRGGQQQAEFHRAPLRSLLPEGDGVRLRGRRSATDDGEETVANPGALRRRPLPSSVFILDSLTAREFVWAVESFHQPAGPNRALVVCRELGAWGEIWYVL